MTSVVDWRDRPGACVNHHTAKEKEVAGPPPVNLLFWKSIAITNRPVSGHDLLPVSSIKSNPGRIPTLFGHSQLKKELRRRLLKAKCMQIPKLETSKQFAQYRCSRKSLLQLVQQWSEMIVSGDRWAWLPCRKRWDVPYLLQLLMSRRCFPWEWLWWYLKELRKHGVVTGEQHF